MDGKYTWNPADYAKHSATQFAWATELIGKLKLNGNETLLDIGSGDGKVTAGIAKQLPRGRVVGVDSSPEMVRQASASFGPPEYPNLSFQIMDARHLDFSEQFDIVFSNATLHWVIDHRPIVEGARRALRNGGRLLFQMGGRGNAQDIMERVNEITFNAPLLAEFRAIDFVARLLDEGRLDPARYKKMLLHRVDGGAALAEHGAASKARADMAFLRRLFELGRGAGQYWLAQHYDDIGVCSSVEEVRHTRG